MTPTPSLLESALQYATRGWHVFPIYGVRDGRCSCGQDCGKSAGKHPILRRGFRAATTDTGLIRSWWSRWADANIGIATGATSGLVVVDVDGHEGLKTLQALVAQHGPLPHTLIARTGRGWHWYFSLRPGQAPVRCSASDGLDIRADGGYIIAPPSRHISGHAYEWSEHVT